VNPASLVGMVLGALLILTAIAVFWTKKDFPAGGLGVTIIGLVLIGMSQWSSFSLKAGGLELQAVQKQLRETVAAAAEVADEAHNSAAAAETTRQQVASLTAQLAARNLVTPQASAAIRRALDAAPRSDTIRLRMATDRLRVLNKPSVGLPAR
jgi:hypothetical protein